MGFFSLLRRGVCNASGADSVRCGWLLKAFLVARGGRSPCFAPSSCSLSAERSIAPPCGTRAAPAGSAENSATPTRDAVGDRRRGRRGSRAGRTRGKSDPLDALAIARAAIREPNLSRPLPDERVYREIKLLVDHRDDLVDQRRRTQQRLRWHLFQLDPTYQLPLRMLGRHSHLERVARWLARRDQELQVQLARELINSCRQLNRHISELDLQLEQRVRDTAPGLLELPGCAAVTAAKLLAEIGPIDRFQTDAQLARHGGVAPLEASSGRTQRHRLDRGGNRQLNAALHRIAIIRAHYHGPARDYLERKRAEGKSRREALRCLKRLLIRVVFNTLKTSPALT